MYARTIICPPIHLFFQAVTYGADIDISITTVELLCASPQALADGIREEFDRFLSLVT